MKSFCRGVCTASVLCLYASIAEARSPELARTTEQAARGVTAQADQRSEDVVAVVGTLELMVRELQAEVETLRAELAAARVQSGVIAVDYGGTLSSGLGRPGDGDCSAVRGLSGQRVDFEQPFSSIPHVLVAVTRFDMETRGTNILDMIVTEVDARGFNYDLWTWCGTRVARVRAEWIAVVR